MGEIATKWGKLVLKIQVLFSYIPTSIALMFCPLCLVNCGSTPANFQQHVQGKKHQLKLKASGTIGSSSPAVVPIPVSIPQQYGATQRPIGSSPPAVACIPQQYGAYPRPVTTGTANRTMSTAIHRHGTPQPPHAPFKPPHNLDNLVKPSLPPLSQQLGTKRHLEPVTPQAALDTHTFIIYRRKPDIAFPSQYAGCLKRKQDVNISISNWRVEFSFHYNVLPIEAIKTCIRGRQWDPFLKVWHAPMECLEDCVALYEHMGRTPSAEVKASAKAQAALHQGRCLASKIHLTVTIPAGICQALADFTTEQLLFSHSSYGTVRISFNYDVDIVSALKQHPPDCRSYSADTKAWTLDILSLPELLQSFAALGYQVKEPLKHVSSSCDKLNKALTLYEATTEPDAASSPEDRTVLVAAVEQLLGALLADIAAAKEEPSEVLRPAKQLTLGETWALKPAVKMEASPAPAPASISPCLDSLLTLLDTRRLACAVPDPKSKADNCERCGLRLSHSRMRRQHLCKFFGTFVCVQCDHRWTSSHTWEGEMQECRECDRSNLPLTKEPLQKSTSEGRGGLGKHDSERCHMCQRIGFNCSQVNREYFSTY